jgi:hypothetical protein
MARWHASQHERKDSDFARMPNIWASTIFYSTGPGFWGLMEGPEVDDTLRETYWGKDGTWPRGDDSHGGVMSSSLSFNPGTSASTQASQNPWAQAQSQFQQLGQALSSGNLSAAQAAFSALQQNAPQGGQSSQNAQGSSAQSPMAALSQALQSGNLSAAQQAFSQIQQAQGQHHHHHHGSQSGSSSDSSTSTASTTATSATSGTTGTTVNLTA